MPDNLSKIDLLITGAAELATSTGNQLRGGALMSEIQVQTGAGVALNEGRIVAIGPDDELKLQFDAKRTVDARGGTIIPGFVDAHTHPVFAGTREEEFELRSSGATYVEISEKGGGILSTVRGVRASSKAELVAHLLKRLDRFLDAGTTTIEAKSGYGLTPDDEIKSLEVIAEASANHAVQIVPTFLGAHDYPAEYRDNKSAYVDLLIQEMLPRVAAAKLAEYCDIFTESHVFGIDDSRRILTAAKELGFDLRLHVDQLSPLGGAELAAELKAHSADHLEFVSEQGMEALVDAGVVPVLCPLVPLYLRIEQEAPGRRMIDRGLAPAISTDFNPGSCYVQSMPEVMTWAALRFRMNAAECLTAATLNAAASLGRANEIGTLEVGKRADLVILDQPSHRFLCYEFGRNPVRTVVAGGVVVREFGNERS
ncbi:MAG: imidazolonepropionase [Planctomycetota bacterium]|jgi:imidazolonepropionase